MLIFRLLHHDTNKKLLMHTVVSKYTNLRKLLNYIAIDQYKMQELRKWTKI